ncbi:hypothetical protein ACC720_39305, partial [Rhizobium ruizarguesonis]
EGRSHRKTVFPPHAGLHQSIHRGRPTFVICPLADLGEDPIAQRKQGAGIWQLAHEAIRQRLD